MEYFCCCCTLGSVQALDPLEDLVNHLIRLALSTQIRREHLTLLDDRIDRGIDLRGLLGVSQVRKQESGRADRGDRVGDTLALDVGCRAVDPEGT